MQTLRASTKRSSPFPWWSLGLLLGFLLVLLWKRLMARRNDRTAGSNGQSRPVITLEEVQVELAPDDQAASQAEPEPEPASPSQRQDDLRKLEGIGPKVQGVLNAAGVFTYAQLARTSQEKLKTLLESVGYGYMDPATWPEQADLAAQADWDGLARLKNALKGGRRR
jgi:predicted flap endonuclease-1-like 5' DNA nuclease